ncbi:hypothetical protein N7447_009342 [Penicillium robsamsonii]|uniref:uncharacterized protein n=1 Tax=Penicillium robsamsonii TaxID=1792511 RepID=UPI0025499CA5|nr:uncharacterized protein N7447_009342 [Penicillium robsamsonii]KAJ5817109.1 hypothetical protein N7447_009342 [Penicillium robsamsonii]
MASPASSACSENQDNFLLARFIHELELPVNIDEASMSATATPPSIKQSNTPNFPSVTFQSSLTSSPGPARSTSKAASTTYKRRNYTLELAVRGIHESEDSPEGLDDLVKRLQGKSDNFDPLTTEETEAFQESLLVPGNEPTIQALIVPPLLNLAALVRSPLTHVAVVAQFLTDCSIPLHRDMPMCSKIPTPWPDFTIGLRRQSLHRYNAHLYELADIAAPINCTSDIVFPCFTVEIKGEDGGLDAINQNRHNAAIMLQNFRRLSIRARGDQDTKTIFDGVPRIISATVMRNHITISVHWTVCLKSGDIMFKSLLIKLFDLLRVTHEEWNNAASFLRSAIEFTIERANQQVQDDLEKLQNCTQPAMMPTRPPKRKHEVLE